MSQTLAALSMAGLSKVWQAKLAPRSMCLCRCRHRSVTRGWVGDCVAWRVEYIYALSPIVFLGLVSNGLTCWNCSVVLSCALTDLLVLFNSIDVCSDDHLLPGRLLRS